MVSGLTLGGGLMVGCENQGQKDMMADMESQNAELRSQKQMLEQQLRDKEAALAAAQAAQQQAATQPVAGGQPSNSTAMNATDFGGIEGVSASQQGGDIVLDVAGSVLFASGRAELTSTAKRSLDRVASVINSKYRNNSIRVEGHTDSDPIRKSRFPSNQALSEARADAVASYLTSKGISRGQIETIGFGSDRPKGSKAASRRVEIVIMGN
jgi:flagellar motor protein MotB